MSFGCTNRISSIISISRNSTAHTRPSKSLRVTNRNCAVVMAELPVSWRQKACARRRGGMPASGGRVGFLNGRFSIVLPFPALSSAFSRDGTTTGFSGGSRDRVSRGFFSGPVSWERFLGTNGFLGFLGTAIYSERFLARFLAGLFLGTGIYSGRFLGTAIYSRDISRGGFSGQPSILGGFLHFSGQASMRASIAR